MNFRLYNHEPPPGVAQKVHAIDSKRVTAGLLRRLDVHGHRLGVEADLRLADQVETAGNQNQVLLRYRVLRQAQSPHGAWGLGTRNDYRAVRR